MGEQLSKYTGDNSVGSHSQDEKCRDIGEKAGIDPTWLDWNWEYRFQNGRAVTRCVHLVTRSPFVHSCPGSVH